MAPTVFPPDPTTKTGFYDRTVYEDAVRRYPTVARLVAEKAREYGDRTWLIFEDRRRFTFRDVDEASARVATALADMGVAAGAKVSYEVEQTLLQHPDVREVAVVPVPSEVGEDEVMAVIVPGDGGVTPEAIIDYCVDNMPRFWIPRYVRFVTALPKTPTGRVEKYKLRGAEGLAGAHDMGEYVRQRFRQATSDQKGA